MGVPGWPLLAACTASIERVRMVLMESDSIGCIVYDMSVKGNKKGIDVRKKILTSV